MDEPHYPWWGALFGLVCVLAWSLAGFEVAMIVAVPRMPVILIACSGILFSATMFVVHFRHWYDVDRFWRVRREAAKVHNKESLEMFEDWLFDVALRQFPISAPYLDHLCAVVEPPCTVEVIIDRFAELERQTVSHSKTSRADIYVPGDERPDWL